MSIPFALSLSKYVNSAGTDVGFACLLAVALLALLYFGGARESRTLREELEDAQDRISGLEGRLAQVMRNQSAATAGPGAAAGEPRSAQVPGLPPRPGVVPAPTVTTVAARPTGTGAVRVQRGRDAAVAGGVATGALLGAPAGAGAPSLGSATKLIPSPALAPAPTAPVGVPVSVPTPAVPAAATAAGGAVAPSAYVEDAQDDGEFDDFGPEDTMYVPASTAAAASGRNGGGLAVALPPRMQVDDDGPAGPPPRRTIPTVQDEPSGARRMAGRLLGALVGLAVVAAIVVALLLITSGGSSHTTKSATGGGTAATHKHTGTKPVFNPADVKVSVLNGTPVLGLATDVAKQLRSSGYTVPKASITNAADQTTTTTTVGYRAGFRADALRVAKSLSRSSGAHVTTVVGADAASITSCATPVGSGQAGTCPANVIVTVGSDLTSAAGSSTNA